MKRFPVPIKSIEVAISDLFTFAHTPLLLLFKCRILYYIITYSELLNSY